MPHPSHKLKAYTGDPHRPLVFCSECGKDENEGLDNICPKTFYVDTKTDTKYPHFVSGLPDNT